MLDQNNPGMQSTLLLFCNRDELPCFIEQPNFTGCHPDYFINVRQLVLVNRLTVGGATPSSTSS